MGELLTFPSNKESHLSGEAICSICRHRWEAVVPLGTWELECPKCGVNKGHFMNYVLPTEDDVWTCKCSCYVFVITTTMTLCANCGQPTKGF